MKRLKDVTIAVWKDKTLSNLKCVYQDKLYVEKWKGINGYENSYQISSFGRVKCIKKDKHIVMSQRAPKNGYLIIGLWDCNKEKKKLVHRLVAVHFIRNIKNKKTVNHKFGNKLNNMWWNLEWNTHKENITHAIEKLNVKYGSGVVGRKDHNKKVVQYSLDGVKIKEFPSQLDASIELGIVKSSISHCVNGIYKTAGGFIWKKD